MGVGIGDAAGVRVGLWPDSGEAEGGVVDTLLLGLWGCGGEEESTEDGGDEDVSDDLGP